MSEAFIIAAAQGAIVPFSTHSYAEQVEPVLKEVFGKSGVPVSRVQELYWFGGPDEFWLPALAQRVEFPADLSRFQWPAVPIFPQAILQSLSRSIELGERVLALLAQQSGEQVIALLLASPKAIGRHNLAPRAWVALRFSISRKPDGFLKAARSAIEKSELETKEVQRFASPARFTTEEVQSVFSTARPLRDDADRPTGNRPKGDLFLLDALICSLEESDAALGLLLSPALHDAALATLVERT